MQAAGLGRDSQRLCKSHFIVKGSKYGECKIQDGNTVVSHNLRGNNDQPTLVRKGALKLFLRILESSYFNERMNSLMSLKREQAVVFAGHSLGGAVATLAIIGFLEKRIRQIFPYFCITFGSPLVGDASLGEAIAREDWSGVFINVVSKYDIVPRMLLAPFELIVQPLSVIFSSLGQLNVQSFNGSIMPTRSRGLLNSSLKCSATHIYNDKQLHGRIWS